MNSQGGTALVMILLFMLVLSLLTIHSLSSAQLELYMAGHMQQRDRLLYAAESALLAGENALHQSTIVACLQPALSANDYAHRSRAWWLSAATCQVSSDEWVIRYIIESLSSETCMRYYRITAYAGMPDQKGLRVLLQTTYTIKNRRTQTCQVTVTQGRQSWCELR